jgi:hypothetical protein
MTRLVSEVYSAYRRVGFAKARPLVIARKTATSSRLSMSLKTVVDAGVVAGLKEDQASQAAVSS